MNLGFAVRGCSPGIVPATGADDRPIKQTARIKTLTRSGPWVESRGDSGVADQAGSRARWNGPWAEDAVLPVSFLCYFVFIFLRSMFICFFVHFLGNFHQVFSYSKLSNEIFV